jgi:hypothetical protein
MREELPAIFRYPFVDPVAFVILAIVVWLFTMLGSIALFGRWGAILFSQGLLFAYSFTALHRVSEGNMKSYIPNINDIQDLTTPLTLGLGVLLISSAPLILVAILYPGAALLQMGHEESEFSFNQRIVISLESEAMADEEDEEEEEEEDEESTGDESGQEKVAGAEEQSSDYDETEYEEYGTPLYIKMLLLLGYAWKIAYAPIALIVAGVSRSFVQTLNPKVGIDSIRRMGSVYWEAMGIYTAITAVQLVVGLLVGWIPIAGHAVRGFTDSYAFLAIGCTLGFAVMKKAPELGLE